MRRQKKIVRWTVWSLGNQAEEAWRRTMGFEFDLCVFGLFYCVGELPEAIPSYFLNIETKSVNLPGFLQDSRFTDFLEV